MRKLSILLLFVTAIAGCEKNEYSYEQPKLLSRSVFSTSINLGRDTSYFRADSICLCDAVAYWNTCGYPLEYEAPVMGKQVYQISGASQSVITGTPPQVRISNLKIGTYKFVGHAFVLGYRSCDDSLMNDNAYDTITITIRKSRKIR